MAKMKVGGLGLHGLHESKRAGAPSPTPTRSALARIILVWVYVLTSSLRQLVYLALVCNRGIQTDERERERERVGSQVSGVANDQCVCARESERESRVNAV